MATKRPTNSKARSATRSTTSRSARSTGSGDLVSPRQGADQKETRATEQRNQAVRNQADPANSDVGAGVDPQGVSSLDPHTRQAAGESGEQPSTSAPRPADPEVTRRRESMREALRLAGSITAKSGKTREERHEKRRGVARAMSLEHFEDVMPPGYDVTSTVTGVTLSAAIAGGARRTFSGRTLHEAFASYLDEMQEGPRSLLTEAQLAGRTEAADAGTAAAAEQQTAQREAAETQDATASRSRAKATGSRTAKARAGSKAK